MSPDTRHAFDLVLQTLEEQEDRINALACTVRHQWWALGAFAVTSVLYHVFVK